MAVGIADRKPNLATLFPRAIPSISLRWEGCRISMESTVFLVRETGLSGKARASTTSATRRKERRHRRKGDALLPGTVAHPQESGPFSATSRKRNSPREGPARAVERFGISPAALVERLYGVDHRLGGDSEDFHDFSARGAKAEAVDADHFAVETDVLIPKTADAGFNGHAAANAWG